MALSDSEIQKIVHFVKKEPRTVQEIARCIGKSWVTADSYIKKIKERTGLIAYKVFRAGTQGALKLVFYNYLESLPEDAVKERLYQQIKAGRQKTDFDFLELFQWVNEKQKKLFLEELEGDKGFYLTNISQQLERADSAVYCLSGNMSFLNVKVKNKKVLDLMGELLKRKVHIKIICRINFSTINNISKLKSLQQKFPSFLEVKHSYQPLRGFIIDDKVALFKDEEQLKSYRSEELQKDTCLFYEIYDPEWISWLQKVFWGLYRSGTDYNLRLRELQRIKMA